VARKRAAGGRVKKEIEYTVSGNYPEIPPRLAETLGLIWQKFRIRTAFTTGARRNMSVIQEERKGDYFSPFAIAGGGVIDPGKI
jgi:hypothetical protein